jgi:hypothetical protein
MARRQEQRQEEVGQEQVAVGSRQEHTAGGRKQYFPFLISHSSFSIENRTS